MSGDDLPTVDGTDLLTVLRSRRVVRDFSSDPVAEDQLWMVLEAGRWATSASNNRVHRCLVLRDPRQIKLVADVSPGIYSLPPVMIVICTDLRAVAAAQLRLDSDPSIWIDAGTLMMNMIVETHAIGLGTCPATSFSRSAVEAVLHLPDHARPDVILQVGHRGTAHPARRRFATPAGRRVLDGLVYWDEYDRGYDANLARY